MPINNMGAATYPWCTDTIVKQNVWIGVDRKSACGKTVLIPILIFVLIKRCMSKLSSLFYKNELFHMIS